MKHEIGYSIKTINSSSSESSEDEIDVSPVSSKLPEFKIISTSARKDSSLSFKKSKVFSSLTVNTQPRRT